MTAKAVAAEANAAVLGSAESFESLTADRASMTSLRGAVAANEAASADARRLASDSALWQRIETNLDKVLASREALAELEKARAEISQLGPELLVAASNVASALPAPDLTANQPYLLRFEVMVDSLQQRARGLGPTTSVTDTVRRLGDAEQYIGQFLERPARRGRKPRRRVGQGGRGGRRAQVALGAPRSNASSDCGNH
jgi:hypothetical protein